MAELKICVTCCSPLEPKGNRLVCPHCGNTYENDSPALANEFQEIASRRQLREFIQAEELCKELLKKQPESSEGYWQSLLAELGVVYVMENGEAKPTFFSYSYSEKEKIKDSANYKNCIKYATADEAKEYERKAAELDSLLDDFFDLVDKESSYDVFISFKSSETVKTADGKTLTVETRDRKKAEEIFNHLKRKGYRVFFSPVSIGKDTGLHGEKYEPRILKALQTSQAMILLGTKSEYLTSQWVENEWRRFLYYMAKGKKKRSALILGYEENMPSLPLALKDTQWPNFDMFKASYLNDLERLVSFVKRYNGLDTVDIEGKTSHKKKVTRERENFEQSTLSIQTFSDELTLSIDKQLELIESDLGTNRRQKTVKKFAELKAEVEAEGRTDGRILALQLVIDCGLNKIADFKRPENIEKVQDMTAFSKIIESGGSKDWLHTVLDNLYRFLDSSCGNRQSRMAALETVLPYDYPRRTANLKALLEKARKESDQKMFDSILPRLNLSDSEETDEILDMARTALKGRQFAVANDYAKKILEEYEDGNIEAKDIMLLSLKRCKSYGDYFAAENLSKLDDSDFEKMKDILSYMSGERRVVKVDEWNREIIDGLKAKWGSRIIDEKTAKKQKPSEIKDRDTDAVIKFYDRFLGFYPVGILPMRIRSAADVAASKRFWYVAMHYYNLALNDASDKADVYWRMMLCDLGCQKESELYDFDYEVVDNEYFDKALKLAEGATFAHIKSVRQKQIDAAEKNKSDKAAARKAATARRIKSTAVNIVMTAAFLLTLFAFVSQILGFCGIEAFFNLWMIMLVPIGNAFPYIVTAATGVLTVSVFALLVRRKSRAYKGSVGKVVFVSIVAALCVTALAFGANLSEKRIGTYDEEKKISYESGCIIKTDDTGKISAVYVAQGRQIALDKSFAEEVKGFGKLDLIVDGRNGNVGLKAVKRRVRRVEIYTEWKELGKEMLKDLPYLEEVSLPFVGDRAFFPNEGRARLFGYMFSGETPKEDSDKYEEIIQQTEEHGTKYKFYIPKSLKKVTIKGGEVGYGAFMNCEMLQSIEFGTQVYNIDKNAFINCEKVKDTADDGVVYVGNAAIDCIGYPSSVVLRDGTVCVGSHAFADNPVLKDVTLPEKGLSRINSQAFKGCYGLSFLTVPASVYEIGENAFEGCHGLIQVTFGAETSLRKGVFKDCYKLCEIIAPKKFFSTGASSSEGLVYFKNFAKNKEESKIVVKDGFVFFTWSNSGELYGYIGDEKEITLPDDCNGNEYDIANYAFYKNYDLAKVVLGKNAKEIGYYAFKGCRNLYSVTLCENLSSIGSYAFEDCVKLLEVVNHSGLSLSRGSNSHGNVANYAKGIITDEKKSNYKKQGDFVFFDGNANYNYRDEVLLVSYLGNETEITLPAGLEGRPYLIMERAFENNLLLEKVVVSELIEKIDEYAFAGCTSLKSVTIGANVEIISVYAFQNCENLESAVFKTNWGWRADGKSLDNLADDKKAAEYLRDVYVKCFWSR